MNETINFIEKMFNRGFLVNEEIIKQELNLDLNSKIEDEQDLIVINQDYLEVIGVSDSLIDWYALDRHRVDLEKERDSLVYQDNLTKLKSQVLTKEPLATNTNTIINPISNLKPENHLTTLPHHTFQVEVLSSPTNTPRKFVVNDFSKIFLSRYRFLEGILRNRQELGSPMTMNRLLSKQERESVSVIGAIVEINETKAGNIIMTLEDPTGTMKVLVSKSKTNLFQNARDLVVDEIIGITGMNGDKIIFADQILWPEVPMGKELKKSEKEEYAIFLSDFHVGSTLFMEEPFEKFLRWINGRVGNDLQRAIAEKIKYIFIAGDVVDGVGIYPSQEEELTIPDLKGQYSAFCNLIKKIPTNKNIIICPGNHDGVHLAEPQAAFLPEYSPELFEIPNVTLVSNPALVNIGKTKTFSGFDVLLYHGYSFDYYVSNVESIRNNGGYHRADLIMKFLLRRRHLAPSFTSTPYFPGYDEDPMIIKKIPDFFLSGHIHYSNVANYRGVTLISGSCWQGKTSYQEKLGHEPEPGRVPIVNLKTREVKILRFM